MQNAITTLRIQNFKSIKDVTMTPRRVNIIIGEPNVGKSNILEAISLLGGMFFDREKFMEGQVRYETIRNLFYDNDWTQEIKVKGEGIGATRLRKTGEQVEVAFGDGAIIMRGIYSDSIQDNFGLEGEKLSESQNDKHSLVNFESRNHLHNFVNKDGTASSAEWSNAKPTIHVKKYTFQKQTVHGKSYNNSFLRPPFGDNLMEVLQTGTSTFRKEIGGFFTINGFNLTLRIEDQKLEITKTLDGLTTAIPYALIADTLQRLIFYLAAIESNTDSVLLFEEPEAHSHPEYVAQLGQSIVESTTNQFFIATHSPYLITEILEEMLPDKELAPELAMFAVYYEDYQTKVRQLTDDEVVAVRADGLDVFFNMGRFIPEA